MLEQPPRFSPPCSSAARCDTPFYNFPLPECTLLMGDIFSALFVITSFLPVYFFTGWRRQFKKMACSCFINYLELWNHIHSSRPNYAKESDWPEPCYNKLKFFLDTNPDFMQWPQPQLFASWKRILFMSSNFLNLTGVKSMIFSCCQKVGLIRGTPRKSPKFIGARRVRMTSNTYFADNYPTN